MMAAEAPTLYGAAERVQQSRGADSAPLRGRAPVYLLPSGTTSIAVRHYFRGGAVASFLGDRYLRMGHPRPIAEALVSEELRTLGFPTPKVVAAMVYARGAFYRGDLATEFIEGGRDLGELLFRSDVQGSECVSAEMRSSAIEGALSLIERLASSGYHHPDLNVKNFFAVTESPPFQVHLLDLDRCRRVQGDREAALKKMVRRFRTSLEKWERTSGRRLTREEWGRVATS